jgi:hypothetical protein
VFGYSSGDFSLLDANNVPPSTSPTLNSVDVTVNVDGALIVDAAATTGNVTTDVFSAGTYINLNSTPLNVTFTIIPRGAIRCLLLPMAAKEILSRLPLPSILSLS